MKLFLSSLAISDSQHTAFCELVGKSSSDIHLAFIENAADPYDEKDRAWVYQNRQTIQSHGFDVEIIDIRLYKGKQAILKEKLAAKDAIWLGGGNVYYLRWLLKDIGVDHILTELVDEGLVYGGGSAGAIAAGPTLKHFEVADDPHDAPAVILDGLHLTDLVVVPHMDNPKYRSVIDGINEKLKADGYTTVPIGDKQALVIHDKQTKII